MIQNPEQTRMWCAPSDQSQDLDGNRPLPQIQAPATDGRLAGGQSRISQSHLCNTGMNSGTGTFTNIDFNNGLFDTGNHDTSQLGLGTNTQSLCIGGLSMGDQGQSRRPAPVFSIFDNVGSHVPTPNREKIWAGGYVDLEVLLKKSRDLRNDPTSSG